MQWIFKGDKIPQHAFPQRGSSMPSFRGEVKPDATCRKILWHIKTLANMSKNNLQCQIKHFLCSFVLLLPDDSACRIVRELWWMN